MKAIIVDINNVVENLDELAALVEACQMEVSHRVVQNLDKINSATFIGSGKVKEIRDMIDDEEIVIFNSELTPLQHKNLTDLLGVEVSDRTDLILRIFQTRAKTREAKLQVEIARDKYLLPRLAGMHESMTGQMGGSGFRGSGEKQIEIDRRIIGRRMSRNLKQLAQIKRQREQTRKLRNVQPIKKVALVGYTNSGKSTLLNTFTNKKVLSKDMLFATLETNSRLVTIDQRPVILSDTVGFIDQLPHSLIDAFASTLEEVLEADLLLHVIDISDPKIKEHIDTTNKVLEQIGAHEIEKLMVYNKIDLPVEVYVPFKEPYVCISLEKKTNLGELETSIARLLFKADAAMVLKLGYDMMNDVNRINEFCKINRLDYLEDGIYLDVTGSNELLNKYRKYQITH